MAHDAWSDGGEEERVGEERKRRGLLRLPMAKLVLVRHPALARVRQTQSSMRSYNSRGGLRHGPVETGLRRRRAFSDERANGPCVVRSVAEALFEHSQSSVKGPVSGADSWQ